MWLVGNHWFSHAKASASELHGGLGSHQAWVGTATMGPADYGLVPEPGRQQYIQRRKKKIYPRRGLQGPFGHKCSWTSDTCYLHQLPTSSIRDPKLKATVPLLRMAGVPPCHQQLWGASLNLLGLNERSLVPTQLGPVRGRVGHIMGNGQK